ncbi:MAG: hypothetical protein R3324_21090, partial [Halobacteriales archaeon]|nr:hypothetical protein [Halobacteriales archaeon]
MSDHGTAQISDDLRRLASGRPHLRDHLRKFKQITGEFPLLIEKATTEYDSRRPNVLYPVGGPIFCHIYGDLGQDTKYYAIEPELDEDEQEVFGKVKNRLLKNSVKKPPPVGSEEYDQRIDELLRESVRIVDGHEDGLRRLKNNLLRGGYPVSRQTFEHIRYRLNRDIIGFGPLEPVMRDPANEDIHVIGPHQCNVDHAVYGMLETTVDFGSSA